MLATLTTILGTVFRPAESALLPVLARSPEELTAANVSANTLDSLGSFVGPALGALLLSFSGPAVVFGIVAGTFAWSAVFVARVHAPPTSAPPRRRRPQGFGGLAGGFRAIRSEPRLRLLIGLYGAQCLVAGALGVLVVVTALDLLSLGNSGVGLLEAASGIGSMIGAAVALALVGAQAPRRRLRARNRPLGRAARPARRRSRQRRCAARARRSSDSGNTLVDISAMTLLQRTAPVEVAGRVFGVVESVTIGGLAVGSLIVPMLVALVGPRGTLIAVGALLPVLAVLTWRQLARIDDGAAVPEEQLRALAGSRSSRRCRFRASSFSRRG